MKLIAFTFRADDVPERDLSSKAFLERLDSIPSIYPIEKLLVTENVALAEKYGITLVPALIKVDDSGNLVGEFRKFGNVDAWREFVNG